MACVAANDVVVFPAAVRINKILLTTIDEPTVNNCVPRSTLAVVPDGTLPPPFGLPGSGESPFLPQAEKQAPVHTRATPHT
jgi:hypothetical protein